MQGSLLLIMLDWHEDELEAVVGNGAGNSISPADTTTRVSLFRSTGKENRETGFAQK